MMSVAGGVPGNLWQAGVGIARTQGLGGLYRGFGATLFSDSLGSALGFTLYEAYTRWFMWRGVGTARSGGVMVVPRSGHHTLAYARQPRAATLPRPPPPARRCRLWRKLQGSDASPQVRGLLGAASAATVMTLTMPMEVVRRRLQAQVGLELDGPHGGGMRGGSGGQIATKSMAGLRPCDSDVPLQSLTRLGPLPHAQGVPGRPVLYRGALHCARCIARKEGTGAFYVAALPGYLKVGPGPSLYTGGCCPAGDSGIRCRSSAKACFLVWEVRISAHSPWAGILRLLAYLLLVLLRGPSCTADTGRAPLGTPALDAPCHPPCL